jgi:uncharacterized protein (DUF2235 family)
MTKNLVVCCDGTSNDVTSDSTNVLRLFRSLQRNEQQTAFYDSGVGTLADPTMLTATGRRVSKKLDMAIGQSVRENVCEAYRFLSRHYQPGDKIFLFGFSRGAYTIRALAGMIHFLGLVHPELDGLAQLAWSVYADDDASLPMSRRFEGGNRFKKAFSFDSKVRIHFVGAWDTVSAFGWIWNLRTVPFSASNPSIDHVRHAVSIDEHRACFQANLFRPKSLDQHESFKQLWFPGAHADVGGGYPEAESGLAKIALEWMFQEAAEQGCLFDQEQVERFLGGSPKKSKISKPDVLAPAHNSTQGFWNLLEWSPRKQWDHNAKPERLRWLFPNLYRRRKIPQDAEFHESVRRKLDEDPGYDPPNLPKSLGADPQDQ